MRDIRDFHDLKIRLSQYYADYMQAIEMKTKISAKYYKAKSDLENFSEEKIMILRIKYKSSIPKPTMADLQGRLVRIPEYVKLQSIKNKLEAEYQYYIDLVFAFGHCKEICLEIARGFREKYYGF